MKNKILSILRENGDYVSGERMSEETGISRAAVWKHIKSLRGEGYEIESATKRGYKLISSPDILDSREITDGLNTEFIGKRLFIYDEIGSTNEQAKTMHQEKEGSVFICEVQNQGKGSHGRGWVSPRGIGIWLSVLLKPDIDISRVSQITLVAGLALCKTIGMGAKIKWPNDIVIGTKKVCGILTEMNAEPDLVHYVVCGIGVNVNTEKFDDEISHRATSMYMESGEKQGRNEIISRLLNNFEHYYKMFLKGGFKAISEEYKENCVTINREVSVIFKSETLRGKAVGVDDNGSLVVETEKGKISVTSGEVSVRGIYGYV